VSGTPTGSVSFFVDGSTTAAATVNLSGGKASFKTSSLSAAAHTVQAVYNGDTTFAGSPSSTVNQTVAAADTTTALTSSKSPSGLGETVTFTATVAVKSPGSGTPTGSVSFFVDGSTTAAATVNLSGGKASFSTSTLSHGPHTVQAVFTSASSNFNGSPSASIPQMVLNASKTTIQTSKSPVLAGQAVTFTATVTPVQTGAAPLGGTVTFLVDGVAVSGAITLGTNGQATFTTTSLKGGNHTITANYSGDSATAGSSASLTQVVQVLTRLSATASTPSPAVGAVFSITVTALDGSGNRILLLNDLCQMFFGSTVVRQANLVNGQVTFNISLSVPGTYTWTLNVDGITTTVTVTVPRPASGGGRFL
jgi:hypothetical protein